MSRKEPVYRSLNTPAPKFGWRIHVSGKENVEKAKTISNDSLYAPVTKQANEAGDSLTLTYNKPENIIPTRDEILLRKLKKQGVPEAAIQYTP